jgi:hypothetical protein
MKLKIQFGEPIRFAVPSRPITRMPAPLSPPRRFSWRMLAMAEAPRAIKRGAE